MPHAQSPVPRVEVAPLLRAAASGRFPQSDGGFSRAAPWRDGVEAALAFTGHAVLVVGEDVCDERLRALGVHGFGGAHDPRATLDLAGDGEVGILDALLVGHGTGHDGRPGTGHDGRNGIGHGTRHGSILVERPDLAQSHRAQHAAQWRDDILVYGFPDAARTALASLGRGIAGLPELGLQADDGTAEALLAGVLALVPAGDVVLASVSPGNARSLRFFLRHGFTPVGSVQLWHPARGLSR